MQVTAVAGIQSLAQDLPYVAGVCGRKKKEKEITWLSGNTGINLIGHQNNPGITAIK